MIQHAASSSPGVGASSNGAARSHELHSIKARQQPARMAERAAARILVAATVPSTIERFLLPLAKHHRSLGWRVDCMARGISHSKSCRDTFDACWEMSLSRNPLAPGNLLRTPEQIRRLVAEQSYDIVHVHSPVAAFVTRMALRKMRRRTGAKIIYTAHGFHFMPGVTTIRERCFLELERIAGPWTDLLVVINEEDYEQALRHKLVPKGRLRHIPGVWLDKNRFDPDRVRAEDIRGIRTELGLGAGERFFLCAAEFSHVKRQKDIVRAFAKLARPEVRLVFAGDGPCRFDTAALAVNLGLQDRTHFLGYRTDVPALMKAAAGLILASEREGLPSVVLEALSVGVPVIATAARGTRELIDGSCGLAVPIGNPPALALAMNFLLDHPSVVRSMVDRGKIRYLRYDSERTVREYDQLYHELLSTSLLSLAAKEPLTLR